MIVDCALYEGGVRLPGSLTIEEAAQTCGVPTRFAWIGLHEPTEEEFETVSALFDLHELAVEDAIKAHQRPKLEFYDTTLFLVLKPARYVDSEEVVDLGEILVFVGERFVVTVRHGLATVLKGIRQGLESRPELLGLGPTAVLYSIVDRVVDDYGPVIAGVERDIEEVEEAVFSNERERGNPVERIYYLKREVLEFHRATAPLLGPLDVLSNRKLPLPAPDAVREYFRDAHDHLLRTTEQIATFRDLLTSILEANLTQVSVRQNEDMRKISAWVAMAAVPTMIAGVYGMNFRYMPELEATWGYPVVLGGMGAICLGLYVFFRSRDWL